MTTILLIIVGIVLFFVAIVSPHLAGKVQRKTAKEVSWLKQMSNWLWDPLTWWAKTTLDFTRSTILKIAKWGKKTRRKLPF